MNAQEWFLTVVVLGFFSELIVSISCLPLGFLSRFLASSWGGSGTLPE